MSKAASDAATNETPTVSLAEELAAQGAIPHPDDEDFEPFNEEELKSMKEETTKEEPTPNKEKTGDDTAISGNDFDEVNLEDFADALIYVFDYILGEGGKAALWSSAFNAYDKQTLEELQRIYVHRKKQMGSELTPYEEFLLDKVNELKETEKRMPLSDKEKEQLRKRLVAMAKTMSFKPSPQTALIITVVMIVSVRLMPVAGNLIERFTSKPAPVRSNEVEPEFTVES